MNREQHIYFLLSILEFCAATVFLFWGEHSPAYATLLVISGILFGAGLVSLVACAASTEPPPDNEADPSKKSDGA